MPRVRIALVATVLALSTAVAVAPALAGSAAKPKVGAYNGRSSTNVKGNQPLGFSMSIEQGKCPLPAARKQQRAFCVTVSPVSLVQSPCTDGFVADEFFPATEPIALSGAHKGKRGISHLYPLYSLGGQTYDRKIQGGVRFGTFQFTLHVDAHGKATGSMRYDAHPSGGSPSCDSGVVTIAAKHR
jgi:hypothetical protein